MTNKTKKVVGSFKAEVILEVPEDWDEKQVWFKYNHEGSWCIDNFFDAMKNAMVEHYKKGDGCCFSCGITEFKYERLPDRDDCNELPFLEI